jgi:hypothetical protein
MARPTPLNAALDGLMMHTQSMSDRKTRGLPAALGIGVSQDILAADLVVQGVEAIARLLPSLSRATPSAVSEHYSELIG